MRRTYTKWQDGLEDYWRQEMGSDFDANPGPKYDKDYWYYQEDTDAECIGGDDAPEQQPNIIFVLGDDWGKSESSTNSSELITNVKIDQAMTILATTTA